MITTFVLSILTIRVVIVKRQVNNILKTISDAYIISTQLETNNNQ